MSGLHRWDLTPAEARELQTELAAKIDSNTPMDAQSVHRVLAVDVSMNRFATWLAAAAVVCDVHEKMLLESSTLIQPIRFPYVTGLLAFREVPALLKAIERLSHDFDAVVVDGQGLAHPRGLGIACHLGLWLDKPTIGLAKTKLSGTHEPVPNKTSASVPLMLDDRQIGVAYRTKAKTASIYISVGHKCRLEDALSLVKRITDNRRIPWPIRAAHDEANAARCGKRIT